VDQKVYLDLGFFEELEHKLGARGDFAKAYVIAHEVGHHIQNLTGLLGKINRLQEQYARRGDKVSANHLQIPVELQADCYAGVWAHYVQNRLEPGDIKEAMNAASAIGDDTLQKKSQGYVVPDSFTHGTSAQRVKAFYTGYKSGDLRACNFFK
jgi:predicted metalloprotease